jgi:hypothetical protein
MSRTVERGRTRTNAMSRTAERGGTAGIALSDAGPIAAGGISVTSGSDDLAPDIATRGIATVMLGGRHLVERAARVQAENIRDIFFVGRLDGDKGAHLLASAAQAIDLLVPEPKPAAALVAARPHRSPGDAD